MEATKISPGVKRRKVSSQGVAVRGPAVRVTGSSGRKRRRRQLVFQSPPRPGSVDRDEVWVVRDTHTAFWETTVSPGV